METVLSVLAAGGLDTVRMLVFFLGPVFLAAYLMYLVASFIGRSAGKSIGLKAFAWLTAPGTVVHELGHALFCVVFRHEIKEIKLFDPQPDGTLGSVSHSWQKGSLYQSVGNFFIGTGPIWFGCAVVFLLSMLLVGTDFLWVAVGTRVEPADLATPSAAGRLSLDFLHHVWVTLSGLIEPALYSDWKFWVFIYLTLCIGLHMSLSPADLKGSWVGFLMLVVVMLVVNIGIAAFVTAFPASSAAAPVAGVTAAMVQFSLAVTGVLLVTVIPAFILMILIAAITLAARLF